MKLYIILCCTIMIAVGCTPTATPAPTADLDALATQTAAAMPTASPTASLTPTASPTPPPTTPPTTLTARRQTNLRGGPGSAYPVRGQLDAGQVVEAAARDADGDWFMVDHARWVAAWMVEVAGDVEALPVEAPPPLPTAVAPHPAQVTIRFEAGAQVDLYTCPSDDCDAETSRLEGAFKLQSRDASGAWVSIVSGQWLKLEATPGEVEGNVSRLPYKTPGE